MEGSLGANAFASRFSQGATIVPRNFFFVDIDQKIRGRIFIDYLRNNRNATAVAPYSARALPRASVSTSFAWSELSEGLRADHFTVGNLRHRLEFLKRDPWRSFFEIRQRIAVDAR